MDMTEYVRGLGSEIVKAAEAGGEDARAVVERLASSLEPAIRLTLLDVLSAAADEITSDLAPGSVEIRLRGREPNFVVTAPGHENDREHGADDCHAPGPGPLLNGGQVPLDEKSSNSATATDPLLATDEESATARINFRPPERLKAAIEDAAGKEGRSVNAWLVRAALEALRAQPETRSARRGKHDAQHYTGWVR